MCLAEELNGMCETENNNEEDEELTLTHCIFRFVTNLSFIRTLCFNVFGAGGGECQALLTASTCTYTYLYGLISLVQLQAILDLRS